MRQRAGTFPFVRVNRADDQRTSSVDGGEKDVTLPYITVQSAWPWVMPGSIFCSPVPSGLPT